MRGMSTVEIKGMESSKLDEEWVYLISQAKNLGLKLDEVREFLQSPTKLPKSNDASLSKRL